MSKLMDVFGKLCEDYEGNIAGYLEAVKNAEHDELLEGSGAILESLYMMVEHDDSQSIYALAEAECGSILNYNYFSFEPQPDRDSISFRNDRGNLTPLGIAVTEGREACAIAVCELLDDGYMMDFDNVHDIMLVLANDRRISDETILYFARKNEGTIPSVLIELELNGRFEVIDGILKFDHFCRDLIRYFGNKCLYIKDYKIMEEWYHWFKDYDNITNAESLNMLRSMYEYVLTIEHEVYSDQNAGITGIELSEDGTCLVIRTEKYTYTSELENEQLGCEVFGGCVLCDGKLSDYVGATLGRIYVTPHCLDPELPERIRKQSYEGCDGPIFSLYGMLFISFETSKGTLQFVVHNFHNGSHPHEFSMNRTGDVDHRVPEFYETL